MLSLQSLILGDLPQNWQSPSWVGIINKCSFVFMLQAVLWKSCVVRLASDWLALGYSGQIYDIVLLSWASLWNLALWVVQHQSDQILNYLIHSDTLHSEKKGLIFLMLNKENLQDRAVLAMWSENVNWWSITTPGFLAVFGGVMVDVPNWMVKLWWNYGFSGATSSSVLARLSWRWWSFIQQEMSVRQAEMRAAIVGSSGWNER